MLSSPPPLILFSLSTRSCFLFSLYFQCFLSFCSSSNHCPPSPPHRPSHVVRHVTKADHGERHELGSGPQEGRGLGEGSSCGRGGRPQGVPKQACVFVSGRLSGGEQRTVCVELSEQLVSRPPPPPLPRPLTCAKSFLFLRLFHSCTQLYFVINSNVVARART